VHAARQLWIGWGCAGDDCAVNIACEGSANAEGNASGKKK